MNRISLCILAAGCALAASAGTPVSNPANRTGSDYVNPVVHADYSDPDAVASADGHTFYLTASSFQCTPGLPILKSTDLVNWELVGYALPAVPPADFYDAAPRHGKGVWAPCLRYHDGLYYIYWGDPDFGIYMIKTADPEGEWSEPVLVKAGKGLIDPSPLWDTDGRAYLANGWAASRAGFNSVITISEMSPDGSRVISQPRIVFDGNDGVNHTIEGPKMYRRGDYYYMFAPAGGVATGWQLVMRSRDIYGPYEARIVMAQGDSDINGPHQGAWVTAADGSDWFLHFQDKGAYGRVLHLQPMEWRADWPVIGTDPDGDGCGTPVRRHHKPSLMHDAQCTMHDAQCTMQGDGGGKTSAENHESCIMNHASNHVSPYQWHANYGDLYGFPVTGGEMRIYGHRVSPGYVNLWEVPNLWLQKFPAEEFTLTAKVRVSAKSTSEGVSSGLVVMGWDYARLGLIKRGERFEVEYAECTDAEQGGAERVRRVASIDPSRIYAAGLYPNMECDLYLRLRVTKGGECRLDYSTDGKRYTEGGRFKARAGKWIGAKAGFYSTTPADVSERGWIDIITSTID